MTSGDAHRVADLVASNLSLNDKALRGDKVPRRVYLFCRVSQQTTFTFHGVLLLRLFVLLLGTGIVVLPLDFQTLGSRLANIIGVS